MSVVNSSGRLREVIGLGSLGFVSLFAGPVAGLGFFTVLVSAAAGISPEGLLPGWLIGLVALPILSLVLGAWTWRTKRVPRPLSGYAIATGAAGLLSGVFLALLALPGIVAHR